MKIKVEAINQKLTHSFFQRDVLEVAPDLIGKILVRQFDNGDISRFKITETEAYRGEEDLACHASKGRTTRTDVMYHEGGLIYVYLIYGMYWMLNFVTGLLDHPQATLIRGIEGFDGPGKLTKALQINKSFYGEDLSTSKRIWVEDNPEKTVIITGKRIGVDYAGEVWANLLWRYTLKK
ncbi:MAG: DNA-3-methyladenine glycosylase [Bacteroidales bacterium]|nr:DNA-3-methyladenine glycosylase [Bacteroidales bacterium]MCF8455928.1 DNA-3-methyladenine glycosylase [Bacteroidales bacterium]